MTKRVSPAPLSAPETIRLIVSSRPQAAIMPSRTRPTESTSLSGKLPDPRLENSSKYHRGNRTNVKPTTAMYIHPIFRQVHPAFSAVSLSPRP